MEMGGKITGAARDSRGLSGQAESKGGAKHRPGLRYLPSSISMSRNPSETMHRVAAADGSS
jgi:hypothetical protein